MNKSAGNLLVVCSGTSVSVACSRAIAWLTDQPADKCQFVMREWIDEEQFRQASLLWIVDGSAPWDLAHFALGNEIPLLVSEDNSFMTQLCVSADCGLYYDNPFEAAFCLEFLCANSSIRRRLGANGYAYLTRRST